MPCTLSTGVPGERTVLAQSLRCAVMSDSAAAFELPPVLGWTELTEVLRLSKTRLRQLEASGVLPMPIAELRMGRVWSTDEIRQWCVEQRRPIYPLQDGPTIPTDRE